MDYQAQAQQLLSELLEAKATITRLELELARYERETISRPRARELHRDLGKHGLTTDEHYLIAERTLGYPVKSFTSLSEDDVEKVQAAAQRVARMRNAGPASPAEDDEALEVLGNAA